MPLISHSLLAYIGLPPCINYSGNSTIAICYNYNNNKTTNSTTESWAHRIARAVHVSRKRDY